jgi:hypothetical protein
MKSILKYMLMTLLAGFISAACSNDEGGMPENTVIYDGKSYSAVSAGLIDYGDYYKNGTYYYSVFVNLEKGYFVAVEILSDSPAFPEGKKSYTYSDSRSAGNLDRILFNIEGKSTPAESWIKSGSATATKNGSNIEISFSLTTLDGKTLSGHYKGINDPESAGR